MTPTRTAPARVAFHTTKYGRELLVDIAWVREMKSFIVDRPHALAFHDIILVTRGHGTFMLDGHRHPVRPGTVLFTAPGQVREWQVPRLDGICLFFPRHFLDEFFTDTRFIQRLGYFNATGGKAAIGLTPARATALRRRLDAMRREIRRLRPDSVHLLRAQAYEVLVSLARHFAKQAGDKTTLEPERRTQRLLELIERNPDQRRGVAFYARELAVTPGYLNTLCRRHLGTSAKTLIAEWVLLEARRRLLYTDASIDQVGDTLGFRDASYFSRFFLTRTGMRPSVFRRGGR